MEVGLRGHGGIPPDPSLLAPGRAREAIPVIAGEPSGSSQPVPSLPAAAEISEAGAGCGHVVQVFYIIHRRDGKTPRRHDSEHGGSLPHRAQAPSEAPAKYRVAGV